MPVQGGIRLAHKQILLNIEIIMQTHIKLGKIRTVAIDTLVSEALAILGEEDLNQLPVVSDGRFEGMISRNQILRILTARAELNM
jgi:CBS domain-containing protein